MRLTAIRPVRGSQGDFQFVDLIPLFVSALKFRNGEQFLKSTAGRGGLLFIHARIVPAENECEV
jgi:hypothetical protein